LDAISPRRGDFGDGVTCPLRLDGQLEPDLESTPRFNIHAVQKLAAVELEAVGCVRCGKAGQQSQAHPCRSGEEAFHQRATLLLAALRVTAGGNDGVALFVQSIHQIDTRVIIGAVCHRDHHCSALRV